jgi:hypothetical protein
MAPVRGRRRAPYLGARTVLRARRVPLAAAVVGALVFGLLHSPTPAAAQFPGPCGSVLVAAGTWLNGAGVDVLSNGADEGTGSSCAGGIDYQCIELVNRLYSSKGWISSYWYGNGGRSSPGAADSLWDEAPSNLTKEANGAISYLAPGDVISINIYQGSSFVPDGHVLIVNTSGVVTSGAIPLVSENSGDPSNATAQITATLSNGTLTIPNSAAWSYPVIGVVHAPGGGSGGQSPPVTIGALDNSGNFTAKSGIYGSWVTEQGGIKAIAVASDPTNGVTIGALDNSGNFTAKSGIYGGWVTEQGGIKAMSTGGVSSARVPDGPGIGTATPANASVSVSFSPPAFDGGSPVTTYTVAATPGGASASGSGSPITVGGLTNGVSYTFVVAASNALGSGWQSTASRAVVPASSQASRCPAGQTGTPPNCHMPQSTSCPAGQTGTPPNCHMPQSTSCPAGQTGTPPNCQSAKPALRSRCVVPDLKHLTLTRAKRALQRAHCGVGTLRRPKHVPRHHVLRVTSQSAVAGSKHSARYLVNLTLR